jgi:hypothetical protein
LAILRRGGILSAKSLNRNVTHRRDYHPLLFGNKLSIEIVQIDINSHLAIITKR